MLTQQRHPEPTVAPFATNIADTSDAAPNLGYEPDLSMPALPYQLPVIVSVPQTSPLCQECPFLTEYRKVSSESGYWQAMHRKATEREKTLKETIAELEAKIRLRERQLFGRKSEKSSTSEKLSGKTQPRRNRGQQPGSPGHGRRSHDHLHTVEDIIDIPVEERVCSECHLPLSPFPGTEDSQEIEIEVKAYRRVIKRKRYKRTCTCNHLPMVITAPPVPKLIPKSPISVSIWVMVLLSKFLFQQPTQRLLAQLRLHGLQLCHGTITGGLKKLVPLFEPVVKAIIEKNRSEQQWHADETRWLVFATLDGKVGHLWYMWVFVSESTVVYCLDPSRSAEVPASHFGDTCEGFLIVDRYSAYKKFVKGTRFILCFCWAHQRRDFIELANKWPRIEDWAFSWVKRISNLYRLNDLRLAQEKGSNDYARADMILKAVADKMVRTREKQLAQPDLQLAARKVLESMRKHWKGLTVFLDYPQVPMDNNTGERALRNQAVGRKNYYGSGSIWSGLLSANLFTIFQTLQLCGINPKVWLSAFLRECARNGGKAPDDISSWLPWNMSAQQRQTFSLKPAIQDSS